MGVPPAWPGRHPKFDKSGSMKVELPPVSRSKLTKGSPSMDDLETLSHTQWNCKYQVIVARVLRMTTSLQYAAITCDLRRCHTRSRERSTSATTCGGGPAGSSCRRPWPSSILGRAGSCPGSGCSPPPGSTSTGPRVVSTTMIYAHVLNRGPGGEKGDDETDSPSRPPRYTAPPRSRTRRHPDACIAQIRGLDRNSPDPTPPVKALCCEAEGLDGTVQ